MCILYSTKYSNLIIACWLFFIYGHNSLECGDGQLQCGDSDQCIPSDKRCDGTDDCGNSWDELNCVESFLYRVTTVPFMLPENTEHRLFAVSYEPPPGVDNARVRWACRPASATNPWCDVLVAPPVEPMEPYLDGPGFSYIVKTTETAIVNEVVSFESTHDVKFHVHVGHYPGDIRSPIVRCKTMYTVKSQKDFATLQSIPFISEGTFVGVVAIEEPVDLKIHLITDDNDITHRVSGTPEDPFANNGTYARIRLKPYHGYIFVWKDFLPQLKTAKALLVATDVPALIYTGLGDRTEPCKYGMHVVPTRLPFYDERYFIVPHFGSWTAIFVTSVHPYNYLQIGDVVNTTLRKAVPYRFNLTENGKKPVKVVSREHLQIFLQSDIGMVQLVGAQCMDMNYTQWIHGPAGEKYTFHFVSLANKDQFTQTVTLSNVVIQDHSTERVASSGYFVHTIVVDPIFGPNDRTLFEYTLRIDIVSVKWPFVSYFEFEMKDSRTPTADRDFMLQSSDAKVSMECFTSHAEMDDGVDNDCDGNIDEELLDFKDNDNDGLADEDTGSKRLGVGVCSPWQEWTCFPHCEEVGEWSRIRSCNPIYPANWGVAIAGQWSQPEDDIDCDRTFIACFKGCPFHRWGKLCDKSCPRNCYQKSCDVKTGACKFGCLSGYVGAFCGASCKPGLFGRNCRFNCSTFCSSPICQPETGECQPCTKYLSKVMAVFVFGSLTPVAFIVYIVFFYGRNAEWNVPPLGETFTIMGQAEVIIKEEEEEEADETEEDKIEQDEQDKLALYRRLSINPVRRSRTPSRSRSITRSMSISRSASRSRSVSPTIFKKFL